MYSVFGERNNKIIHIDDITPDENGLRCNCICPHCKEKLIAKTLGKKNRGYFCHVGNTNCTKSLETSLHKFAKEVIETERKIVIPKLLYYEYIPTGPKIEEYTYKEIELISEQIINCEKVVLEKYLSSFDFKPDIMVFKKNIPLIIEIAVTHTIDDDKKKKIIKSNISTLEIYLDKKEILELSKDELAYKIIYDTSNKKWIFNRIEKNEITKFIKNSLRR